MIFWSKQEPSRKIVDVLGLAVKKDATLKEAGDAYLLSDRLVHPSAAKQGINNMLSVLDGKRKISVCTVADALKVFAVMTKRKSESEGHGGRAALVNVIRYHITGEVPAPMIKKSAGTSDDEVGKLKFSKAKIADILHLVPLYSHTGRFGWLKGEVQKQIHSLGEGEAGMIEAPKRSMDDKEAKAMCAAVSSMFAKGKLPWVIRFNPNEKFFIVMRKSDFEKLTRKGA
jgi:hypothetical protein